MDNNSDLTPEQLQKLRQLKEENNFQLAARIVAPLVVHGTGAFRTWTNFQEGHFEYFNIVALAQLVLFAGFTLNADSMLAAKILRVRTTTVRRQSRQGGKGAASSQGRSRPYGQQRRGGRRPALV
jgi:hypothetical protein